MKRNVIIPILAVLFALPLSAQGWRGQGRIHGIVTDADGNPVAGATVMLRSVRAGGGGPDIKTKKDGRWSIAGLIGGTWNIDIEATGFLTRQLSVEVSELTRSPAIETVLDPAPPPQEATAEEIRVGDVVISPEIAEAIENGNRLLVEGKFAEAIPEYEKALEVLPDNLTLRRAMARACYGAGDLERAATVLQSVIEAEPADVQTATLLATVLLESGELERGKTVLEALPEGTLTDPALVINVGILFMNQQDPASALDYFDQAVGMDEARAESYYYRALANVQLKNFEDAKRDLEKTIELAPDAPEAGDAKELLKAMN